MNAVSKNETLEPSALWIALTTLPRPTKEVFLPRYKDDGESVGSVLMWPLKQEEVMAANAEADRFVKRLMRDPQKKEEANLGYQHNFTNELAIQILHRACRRLEDARLPAFPTADKIRAEFTNDEIGVLFNNYCTVQAEVGPIRAYMSDEEHEALIVRLVEGGSALPFDSLSWGESRALVRFMASQLVSFWMATCRLGSPPAVSSYVSEWLQRKAKEVVVAEDGEGIDLTTSDPPSAPEE